MLSVNVDMARINGLRAAEYYLQCANDARKLEVERGLDNSASERFRKLADQTSAIHGEAIELEVKLGEM